MTARLSLAAVVAGLVVGLGNAPAAEPLQHLHCPKSPYSCCHWWFPNYYQLKACCNGASRYVYSGDRYPGLPATYRTTSLNCQPTDPAVLVGQRLTVAPPPPVLVPEPAPPRMPPAR